MASGPVGSVFPTHLMVSRNPQPNPSMSLILSFVIPLRKYFFVLVVPPEERYATQLSQLQEMGFFDTQENIRALIATAGNVHAAVERLLQNFGQ